MVVRSYTGPALEVAGLPFLLPRGASTFLVPRGASSCGSRRAQCQASLDGAGLRGHLFSFDLCDSVAYPARTIPFTTGANAGSLNSGSTDRVDGSAWPDASECKIDCA